MKPPTTRTRGFAAEDLAARYLEDHGYRIVERNFLCKLGEIDIIAYHNDELVFVEVRSGKKGNLVDPIYSINYSKQKKIIRAASLYLAKKFSTPPFARFDVVVVTLGAIPNVELIPNAFMADY